MGRRSVVIVCMIAISLVCGAAHAADVTYNGFSSTAGLTLNGSSSVQTTVDGQVLRVCPAAPSSAGSVFSSTTVNAANFSTFFKFRITNRGGSLFDGNTVVGADGIVFVVQSVSNSIGGGGYGIGYVGIGNSVGAEFDTWHNSYNYDPDSNHLGIDINGVVNHGPGSPYTQPISPDFDDGNIWYAWIDYNGTNLEVRTNQTGVRSAAADLSRPLNISTILGQNNAYVGFTSGTGADWGNHDILYWTYRDHYDPVTPTVPEPGSLLLAMPAMVGVLFRARRRAR
ncbi:MAG: lectin-like domain-containing protein [Armatimonadota bacterium]